MLVRGVVVSDERGTPVAAVIRVAGTAGGWLGKWRGVVVTVWLSDTQSRTFSKGMLLGWS
ncbi:hypothetical protein T484DRAFT_1926400 [Baffinella frigidus]|nr:hypothetical protein T484DRAFT_1926400 [Cryptophyta sp. CCMP2293]